LHETPAKVTDGFKITGLNKFKASVLTHKSWYIWEWNPIIPQAANTVGWSGFQKLDVNQNLKSATLVPQGR